MSLYVYALADAPAQTAHRGLAGEPLRWVDCGGFFAAVGEVASAPGIDPGAIKAHDATARALATECRALLPTRFGSVVRDEAELRDVFRRRAPELREALDLVAGREQMTLRIFGAQPASPEVKFDPRAGPGTNYLRARLEEHRALHQAPELEPIRPALAPFVHAERVERRKGAAVTASVYHLIARGQSAAYQAALQGALGALGDLRLVVSGPWPAYAFAPEALA